MAKQYPTHDFHMHLNGSFSKEFLRETAKKNNSLAFYETYEQAFDELQIHKANKTTEQYSKETTDLVWAMFNAIHNIVRTLEDIHAGTLDVVKNSNARYLEIRTTAKPIGKASWQDYAEVFVNALLEAKEKFPTKQAYGLLSLDRTVHNENTAKEVIDYLVKHQKQNDLLVGLDLGGKFSNDALRTLTGDALRATLQYALEKNINLALHVGEIDSTTEHSDIDVILSTLEKWYKEHANNSADFFHGKVRLGHAIFLNDKERHRIKALQLPIEVCPTCHDLFNWASCNKPHPIKETYSKWDDPVVSSTDDFGIFITNAKKEKATLLKELEYPHTSHQEANKHHAKFRFSRG